MWQVSPRAKHDACILGYDVMAASCVLRSSPANMTKPMIFALGTMLCRADAVSTPYNIGMLRSSMTISGARSLAFATAASPLPASRQALKGVALSMKLQIAPRTAVTENEDSRCPGRPHAEETTGIYYLGQYDFSTISCTLCKFCGPSVAQLILIVRVPLPHLIFASAAG